MKVCVHVCLCEGEGAYVCLLTYVQCVCFILLYNTLKYAFSVLPSRGRECQALVLLSLSEDYDLKGVCCSGRGSCLTQG